MLNVKGKNIIIIGTGIFNQNKGVSIMGYLKRLLEKLFIIAFCLYNTYKKYPAENLPLYFLIILIISSLLELAKHKNIKALLYILFTALTFYHEILILYIPEI